MAVTGALPYDLNNLIGGGARVVLSDDDVAFPAIPPDLSAVIDLVEPYATKAGWVDVGATTEGSNYSRGIDTDGYEIEQSSGLIFEEVTEITRQLSLTMGELRPDLLKVFENAAAVDDIAAGVLKSAQKAVKFGAFSALDVRRVVLIGQRNKKSGVVTEGAGGLERGRFLAVSLYSVTLAAEEEELEAAKGSLWGLPLTLTAFPEDGQPQGEEYGQWLDEQSGVIALV